MIQIICPSCKIKCESIGDYETIGKCPKCNELFYLQTEVQK